MSRLVHDPARLLEGIRQLLSQLSGEVALLQESYDRMRTTIERLELRSDRDDLTGLLRREAFFRQWEMIKMECQNHEKNCSLLFVDVDHFKSINDCHGHVMGDQALKELAMVLKKFESPSLCVGRYGGEEFVIGLVGEEKKNQAIAEWVRKQVEALPFLVPLTVSVGIAHSTQIGYNTEQLVIAADQALYWAKSAGRNQVKISA